MDVATTTVGLTDLKFRLVRDDFADAVAWVARTLPTRPTVPVLAGVLLTGSDDGLTISGFDYEVSAEVRLAAEIASPGTALVSGRLLSDITKALPNTPNRLQSYTALGVPAWIVTDARLIWVSYGTDLLRRSDANAISRRVNPTMQRLKSLAPGFRGHRRYSGDGLYPSTKTLAYRC